MIVADGRVTTATGTGTRVHRAAPAFSQDSARGNAQPCVWWCRFREDHRPQRAAAVREHAGTYR